MLRVFGWSIAITVVVLAASLGLGGPEVFTVVALLAVLEISLSFDNAVVNATVVRRMSHWWRRFFLTVGVIIAVFGMRLVFPLVIVAVSAGIGPGPVLDMAINDPDQYALVLEEAHPTIAAFGGMFLALIFLNMVLEPREEKWIPWIEGPLQRLHSWRAVDVLIALIGLLAAATWLAGDDAATVLSAGIVGVLAYLVVHGLASFFAQGLESTTATGGGAVAVHGRAAFFLFLYLEVLDASFSLDGVVGAFAITSDVFVIAAGLGIGAMYVRSMTVFLVERGTLGKHVYLEHGAHYAIGALALILLLSIAYDVPSVVTGLIGVGFIAAALLSSWVARRRDAAAALDRGDSARDVDATP